MKPVANLDSVQELEAFDSSGVLSSIRLLADQLEQGWNEAKTTLSKDKCVNAKNVVISGMGGSALGGRIVKSMMTGLLRTPLEVVTEYQLPNYVGPDTLVIISSYSGNTEETLSSANFALQRGAQMCIVATGGKLADFKQVHNIPGYICEPLHNPSGQPRMALGYSVASLLAILSNCEFFPLSDEDMVSATTEARRALTHFGIHEPLASNTAKVTAKAIKGKFPVLVASEHLVGTAHAFKNQLNESAKSFSVLFDIPELNHHLMEGLRNPSLIKEHILFLFIESDLYSERVQKRYRVTDEIVTKNEIETITFKPLTNSKLSQVFELLGFASFVQFYLAALYGVDPAAIPWVDYFKDSLEND